MRRPPAEHHQLEGAVERSRVGGALVDQRQAVGEVVAERLRGEDGLTGAHPVDVAAQGVDLAVVGDHPQRLRELPARRRVRREPRVDDREGAAQREVAQVGVELRELRRGEHPLVDDRPAGHARERDVRAAVALGAAADDEQAAVEGGLVGDAVAGLDEELADPRRRLACELAAGGLVDRNLTPADDPVAGRLDQLLDRGGGSARCRRRCRGARSTSRPRASRGGGGRRAWCRSRRSGSGRTRAGART